MPINYKNYPKDWRARRARILERAGHKCEHCGVPNYATIEPRNRLVLHLAENYRLGNANTLAERMKQYSKTAALTVVLTVAHLDQDEWNHGVKDERLAALCQKCHFAHDRVDNAQRKKYGKQYKKQQLSII